MSSELERHTTTWHCPEPPIGAVYQVVDDAWTYAAGRRPHRDIYKVLLRESSVPVRPANPYLACASCGEQVTAFTSTGEGEGPVVNQPCGHRAAYIDRCPSWSPVDGCRCLALLGEVLHELVPGR